jgi:DNA-directed RNA polymerase subunit omega
MNGAKHNGQRAEGPYEVSLLLSFRYYFVTVFRKQRVWFLPFVRRFRVARITVEDCLQKIPNRFQLIVIAARRAKELLKGARPLVASENKEVVTALREIAAGKVWSEPAKENK